MSDLVVDVRMLRERIDNVGSYALLAQTAVPLLRRVGERLAHDELLINQQSQEIEQVRFALIEEQKKSRELERKLQCLEPTQS